MKVLILGASGQVGGLAARRAMQDGHDVTALSRKELDICDDRAIRRIVATERPQFIINGAVYNDVDKAEDEPDLAFAINAHAPAALARIAREVDSVLVHYSSDYVFDGTKQTPYTEEDEPRPLSVYGRSKLEGEQAVLREHPRAYVLRTAWVYAPGGDNFVSRLLAFVEAGKPLRYINDAWSTPTYAQDLVDVTFALAGRRAPFGLYHAVGTEACTPFGWARAALKAFGMAHVQIEPVPSSAFPTKAPRPRRSVLANTKLAALCIAQPAGLERLTDYAAAVTKRN